MTAFMVESNRIRHFGGHFDPSTDENFDVEVEASPYIDMKMPVEKQVDVFMGMKSKFDDDWDDPAAEASYHQPLTLLDSGNPVFADFQPHNSSIFSIHDDVSWTDKAGTIIHPEWATISYAVFGYYFQHDEGKTMCHGSLFDVEWKRDKKPTKVDAETIATNMTGSQPIALGSHTLDALETYLHNLQGEQDWVGLIDEMKLAISQAGKGGMMDNHIPQNLRAGFKPTNGGRVWRYNNDAVVPVPGQKDDTVGKEHVPTSDDMIKMFKIDRRQAYADALERHENYLRHRLFCEWWKRRARIPGGKWSDPKVHADTHRRVREDLAALNLVRTKKLKYNQNTVIKEDQAAKMHPTAKDEFFSWTVPSIIVGGCEQPWPAEFLTTEKYKPRKLEALPFHGTKSHDFVQKWLNGLVNNKDNAHLCVAHDMKLFFESEKWMAKVKAAGHEGNKGLMKLPNIFNSLDNLGALKFSTPGWVGVTVDALMQEWAYTLSFGDPEKLPTPKPAYYSREDTYWENTQPCKALFVEWELDYYHLPKRFWRLERNPDGTADYRISPNVNISSFDMMEAHKRTMSGRSILRPNAEWPMTTLVKQMLDKLDGPALEEGRVHLQRAKKNGGILENLTSVLKNLNLLSANLEGFTDNLLTLHSGLHISPYEPENKAPKKGTTERDLLDALLDTKDGQDVTPYGEDDFSIMIAEKDFKPVTHGQARFTKFNIVDKFGQVVSPIHNPLGTQKLYPCLGRSLACQTNEAEGGNFANSVTLDDENCSQYFQLGHRINQDARLNTYFAVNSADSKSYHESTQFFKGDGGGQGAPLKHSWRRTTEYEDPVWGWLMLDFRTQGIQVYNAEGESMGEALVPDSIHGKAYWQVYYAEGDLSEGANENSQLQQFIRRMSNTKFLIGLWAMLSEACQNIYHDPISGDAQMLNMLGRPLALVNIGMNLELATPVMESQSYQDLLKPDEIKLDEYKFEVLMGDKANLHDGLIGYFPSTTASAADFSDKIVREQASRCQLHLHRIWLSRTKHRRRR